MEIRKDKGTAGLTLLISLVASLFAVGLIVMIFAIMSGKMADSDILYTLNFAGSTVNESVTSVNALGDTLTANSLRDGVCKSVITAINSSNGAIIPASNYSLTSACVLTAVGTSVYNGTTWKVTYNYTYSSDNSGAIAVINDTSSAIAGVTDWFDIFVVIGAMVVLILLVVLIIYSIRGSGMIGGEPQTVGTA